MRSDYLEISVIFFSSAKFGLLSAGVVPAILIRGQHRISVLVSSGR
jgi:hypothetical protein